MLAPGRHGGADRQRARVVEGAVADVLEDVLPRAERRLAEPGGALAAHLGEAARVAVHPLDHEVAADPGQRLGALGHVGRAAVRAAGAEIGQPQPWPGRSRRRPRSAAPARRAARAARVVAALEQALGDRDRDLVRGQVAVAGNSGRRPRPACRRSPAGAAGGRAAPWPGPRSGRASPRPRRPARARPRACARPSGSSGQVMPTL